jgi:hypothetical protein
VLGLLHRQSKHPRRPQRANLGLSSGEGASELGPWSAQPVKLTEGLIVFSGQKLRHLLDVSIVQVDAEHLARLRPHADKEILITDPIEYQIVAVVASDR